MNILIVDDEAAAREALRLLIENFVAGPHQIREAASVPDAVRTIQEEEPELVFLDIEMPEYNGFELFKFISKPSFSVIFSTAYNEHALKAFEVSAVDYLLKPVIAHRLVEAVNRVIERRGSAEMAQQQQIVQQMSTQDVLSPSKVIIQVAQGVKFLDRDDVLYAQADGSYTRVFLQDEDSLYLSRRLNLVAESLAADCFIRVNRSYIINSNHIEYISRSYRGIVRMNDGHEILVSKEQRDELLQRLALKKA